MNKTKFELFYHIHKTILLLVTIIIASFINSYNEPDTMLCFRYIFSTNAYLPYNPRTIQCITNAFISLAYKTLQKSIKIS